MKNREVVKPYSPRKKIIPLKGRWKSIPKTYLNPKTVKDVPEIGGRKNRIQYTRQIVYRNSQMDSLSNHANMV